MNFIKELIKILILTSAFKIEFNLVNFLIANFLILDAKLKAINSVYSYRKCSCLNYLVYQVTIDMIIRNLIM